MPFTYPCRLLEDEQQVVIDSTSRNVPGTMDWTNLVTKQVTLSKAMLVYIYVKVSAGSDAYGAVRVTDGTNVFLATGGLNNTTVEREVLVPLSAGSYNLNFQGSCWSRGTTYVTLEELKVGVVNFADLASAHYRETVTVPANDSANLIDKQFTMPSGKTPAGPLKQVPLYIVTVAGAEQRGTEILNSSGSTSSGKHGVKLQIDGSFQNWDFRYDDDSDGDNSNLLYGEGSFALAKFKKNAGDQVHIVLIGYDETGSSMDMTVDMWVFACPWILPGGWSEPVSLDFPIYSTLNVTVEPLMYTANAYVYLGKNRVKSFGNDTDYYDSASGSGIFTFSHTFEKIKPSALQLLFLAASSPMWASCISSIMVDVR